MICIKFITKKSSTIKKRIINPALSLKKSNLKITFSDKNPNIIFKNNKHFLGLFIFIFSFLPVVFYIFHSISFDFL